MVPTVLEDFIRSECKSRGNNELKVATFRLAASLGFVNHVSNQVEVEQRLATLKFDFDGWVGRLED
ncbi:hypothetical protein D3C72_2066640 [compost metagenome]